jgi:hypothetical protein
MAPAIPVYSTADDELITLCNEFHRIRTTARDMPGDDIEQFCRLLRIQRAVTSIIMETPTATDAGIRAKVLVALAMMADGP